MPIIIIPTIMTVVLIYEDVFGDDFGEEGFYIF